MYKFLLAGLVMLACSSYASVSSVQSKLQQKYPQLNIQNIQSTEVQGLYSAALDDQIIYLTEDAEHILIGSMIRLNDQRNLTKDLVVSEKTALWQSLPLKDAIKTIQGNGSRQIAIFSDPNCPYCKQLEKQLNLLNNVTIYTFIYPIRAQSVQPAKQVWCQADPATAWHDLINKNVAPKVTQSCDNPIDRNLKLGQRLSVKGTPTLILTDGTLITGFKTVSELEKLLK